MRYLVYVKVDGRWETNGDGALPFKTAERIVNDLRRIGYKAKLVPATIGNIMEA